jgi:hypothetical protein
VYLHTDCGLRWVDLGVIPPDHAPSTVADTAAMTSGCMAISDPWGMGALNLEYLTDPPWDDPGLGLIRQWSLGLVEVPERLRLQFLAVGYGHPARLARNTVPSPTADSCSWPAPDQPPECDPLLLGVDRPNSPGSASIAVARNWPTEAHLMLRCRRISRVVEMNNSRC